MKIQMIKAPGGKSFHDSSLIDVQLAPQLDRLTVILCTDEQELWQISFSGILRFEYENTSWGPDSYPAEVYDIYVQPCSDEAERWKQRLAALDAPDEEARSVKHIVLASSQYGGWGTNEALEGINIVCLRYDVTAAPSEYQPFKFRRPAMEAGEE